MSSPQIQFLEYLNKNKMAATEQRRIVLEVFLGTQGHHSCEELYEHVSKRDPSISPATVYRTIKLIAESGIAEALDFGDGITRFECRHDRGHHDHLVCIRCKRRIEVIEYRIEALQEKLASKHEFEVHRHKMVLYGVCPECRNQ